MPRVRKNKVSVRNTFMGMATKIEPEMLPPNFAQDCNNVQVVNGSVEMRPGYTKRYTNRNNAIEGFDDFEKKDLAKWRVMLSSALAFDSDLTVASRPNQNVYGIAVASASSLIAVGDFTNTLDDYMARWNGTVWTGDAYSGAAADGIINVAQSVGTGWVVAGAFATLGGVTCAVATISVTQVVTKRGITSLTGTVHSLTPIVPSTSDMFIGGEFSGGFRKFDTSSASVTGAFDKPVYTVMYDSGTDRCYIGGDFTKDTDTGQLLTKFCYYDNANGGYTDLKYTGARPLGITVVNGIVYVMDTERIWSYDDTLEVDDRWVDVGAFTTTIDTSVGHPYNLLDTDGSVVIAVGPWDEIGGVDYNGLAYYDGAWHAIDSGFTGGDGLFSVNASLVDNLYVGGNVTSISGESSDIAHADMSFVQSLKVTGNTLAASPGDLQADSGLAFGTQVSSANQIVEFDMRLYHNDPSSANKGLDFNVELRSDSQLNFFGHDAYRVEFVTSGSQNDTLTINTYVITNGSAGAAIQSVTYDDWQGISNIWTHVRLDINSTNATIGLRMWQSDESPNNTNLLGSLMGTSISGSGWVRLFVDAPGSGGIADSQQIKNFILRRRTGSAARVDGLKFFQDDEATEFILAHSEGHLKVYDSNLNEFVVLENGLTTGTKPPVFETANDMVYLANGNDRMLRTDGLSCYSVGLDVPKAFTISTAGGGSRTGTYEYKITAYNPVTATESNATAAVSIVAASVTITLNFGVPVDLKWATQYRIYRAIVSGGQDEYFLVDTIDIPGYSDTNSNWGTWVDTVADGDESLTLFAPTAAFRGKKFINLKKYNGRLFGFKENDSELFFSESEVGSTIDYFPATNSLFISRGDGDFLTGLFLYLDFLTIFKENSINLLEGSSVTNFEQTQVDNSVGAGSQDSIQQIDAVLWFANKRGIFSFNGQSTRYVSEIIDTTWQGYVHTRDANMVAAVDFATGHYILSITATGSEQDTLLAIATRRIPEEVEKVIAYSICPWGLGATAIEQEDKEEIIFALNGFIYTLTGNDDDSADITWNWTTGKFDLGFIDLSKRWHWSNTEYKTQASGTFLVTFDIDNSTTDSTKIITQSSVGPAKLHLGRRGNLASVKFSGVNNEPVEVLGFTLVGEPNARR